MEDYRDRLNPEAIERLLGSSMFSRKISFHDTLDSTNTLAKELAAEGTSEGTVVLAEVQTRGRGRLARRWVSPAYVNLMFSIIFRPNLVPERVFDLTVILSLAALEAIEAISGCRPGIKWPNDLYLENKKIAGILSEFSLDRGVLEYVVLGLGINVNWHPLGHDPEMRPSTSLLAETGKKIDRNELLAGILKIVESYYRRIQLGHTEEFYRKWNDNSLVLGREVEIVSSEGSQRGRAVRIDQQGALVVRDEGGREKKVMAGDVSVRF